MVYADNASTTQLAPEALAAMMPLLQSEYGNASQMYSFARTAKKALKEARQTIAECINASPEEIFFTSGGTESDNWALKGIMFVHGDQRALITSQIEHHAVLNSAASIERMGYPVVYLPVNAEGVVLPEVLHNYITVLSANGLIILEFCGSIKTVFSILSVLHTGRRQQRVNPLMVRNWVKASRRERMVFIRDGS